MKTILSVIFCMTFFFSHAGNIVSYSKSNKGLFGYDRVNSTNAGTDADGNMYWAVDCHDPGLIKCRRTLTNNDDPILIFADAQLVLINDKIDIELNQNNESGTFFDKILRTVDGIQTWVTFNTMWETINGEVLVTIVIDEVPFTL